MKNLVKRVITSSLLILFIAATIFIFPNWFFCFIVSLFIGMGLYEFYAMVDKKGILVYRYFGVGMGILLPIFTYLRYGGFFPEVDPFLIVFACLFVFIVQFTRKDNSQALVGISVTLLGILYVSWFFSFLIKLKYLPNGSFLVAYLLLVTKLGDIGSYFVGSAAGRHSLIPRISPRKTIEGTFGGLVFSMAAAFLAKGLLPECPTFKVLILGFMLGVLSQTGDLSESLIKRDCGVKDTGNYLPGLGGVLDVMDSLLFTIPIFYFYAALFL
ncbi:MAG: phosphatidate cytidylyltransferase [Candidatus Omnitrophota bacterium]